MKRSEIREQTINLPLVSPDFAALYPGYKGSLVYGWTLTSFICTK